MIQTKFKIGNYVLSRYNRYCGKKLTIMSVQITEVDFLEFCKRYKELMILCKRDAIKTCEEKISYEKNRIKDYKTLIGKFAKQLRRLND